MIYRGLNPDQPLLPSNRQATTPLNDEMKDRSGSPPDAPPTDGAELGLLEKFGMLVDVADHRTR